MERLNGVGAPQGALPARPGGDGAAQQRTGFRAGSLIGPFICMNLIDRTRVALCLTWQGAGRCIASRSFADGSLRSSPWE